MEVIRAARNLRVEMKVNASKRATLILKPAPELMNAFKGAEGYFMRLAAASGVEYLDASAPNPEKSASAVTAGCSLFIPLGELVDVDKEIARMNKDLTNAENEIARADAKLHNEGFLAKAPAQLVEQEKAKLEEKKTLAESIRGRIRELVALR